MMIPMLIAGTYTPASLLGLGGKAGIYLLIFVWSFAIGGMILKMFWVNCPKWVSSALYIGMGWSCVLAIPSLYHTLPLGGFLWLLIGGILYTIGGVIYALKLDVFNERFPNFGSHEIFHLFIMGGTFCHYVFIYFYLT
jgi:hemolysin III